MRPVKIMISVGFVLAGLVAASEVWAQGCPYRPPCRGCGCRGGPGYRGPDGNCVGFKDLDKVCGVPPTENCVFENAPGTGANRECALRKKERRKLVKKREETALTPQTFVSSNQ